MTTSLYVQFPAKKSDHSSFSKAQFNAYFLFLTLRTSIYVKNCTAEFIPLNPKGVDLFYLALQRKNEARLAFLDRGTPPFPQTYFFSVTSNTRI
jgi:hypothetical protein